MIISWIILFWYLLTIIIKKTYLWELAISFFPYFWIPLLIGLLYRIVQVWKFLYQKNSKKRYAHFFILWFWILLVHNLLTVQNFYHQPLLSNTLKNPIKIMFSNIYKDNMNIDAITTVITKEKPDILLFVEFSEEHKKQLKQLLEPSYPYMNIASRSKLAIGGVVFSKYPITNLNTNIQQGHRRYWYFSISKDNIPYYFYLIHTASPVSKHFFKQRNNQLQQVASDIKNIHSLQRPQDTKVIMIGDFNTSPWSTYYQNFTTQLSGIIENATRAFPLVFTRDLGKMIEFHKDLAFLPNSIRNIWKYLPLQSHIDQLFISQSVKIQNLKTLQITGSDHKGFVFEIE